MEARTLPPIVVYVGIDPQRQPQHDGKTVVTVGAKRVEHYPNLTGVDDLTNRGLIHEDMAWLSLAKLKSLLNDPEELAKEMATRIRRYASAEVRTIHDHSISEGDRHVVEVYIPEDWLMRMPHLAPTLQGMLPAAEIIGMY